MDFDDDVYLHKAIEQGILSGPDALELFRFGHLRGLPAIKLLFRLRVEHVPTLPPKASKQIYTNTIEKIRNGYYNGKNVDDIVSLSTRFLGERYGLYRAIEEADKTSRLLSRDGKYALPEFQMREVDPYDPRYDIYEQIFHEQMEKRPDMSVPRTREDFFYMFDAPTRERNLNLHDLDMVISYLLLKDLI